MSFPSPSVRAVNVNPNIKRHKFTRTDFYNFVRKLQPQMIFIAIVEKSLLVTKSNDSDSMIKTRVRLPAIL